MEEIIKIEALKIRHPFIEDVELRDLQRINVICGKNSSGKSTLIKAIAESFPSKPVKKVENHRSFLGKRLSLELIVDSFREMVSSIGTNEELTASLKEIISDILKNKPVWYADEHQNFNDTFSIIIVKHPNLQAELTVGNINKIVKGIFNFELLKILDIPHDRTRHLHGNTSGNKSGNHSRVEPNGTGIVQQLFLMQNYLPTHQLHIQYQELKNAFHYVTSGTSFLIETPDPQNIVVHFSRKQDIWFKGDDCGLGLKDIIVILYHAIVGNEDILLVEEPENHLHPEIQRKLLTYLREHTDKQYFFATHSNIFLDDSLVDRVFLTSAEDKIHVTDATSKAVMLNELGYTILDNLVSDLVILVEGPTDKPVIEEFLEKLGIFQKYMIKIWPLCGNVMDQLDLSIFSQNYNMIALIDLDPKSEAIRNNFIKNCEEIGIPVRRLKKYAIENYFSIKALRKVFPEVIPGHLTHLEGDKTVKEQIGRSIKKYNREITREMTLEDIQGTDLYEFFEEVKKLLESTPQNKVSDLKELTP